MKSHYKSLSFISLFFLAIQGSGQKIKTVIGTGENSCFGDGKPALQVGANYPYDVCVDANGDIYFTCSNAVRKLDAQTGIVNNFAGSSNWGYSGDGGPAINATFKFTFGIALNTAGDLFITEYSGHRIRKVAKSTGIVTTVAGNGIAGFSGDGGLAINASINTPQDIVIDQQGDILFSDYSNGRIRKINSTTGIISTIAGNGNLYSHGDGGLAINAGVPYPGGLCLDTQNNVFIACGASGSCYIRRVDAVTKIISTVAGNGNYSYSGDGGPAINASLHSPSSVCVDTQNNIYIATYDDSRIRKVNALTGNIETIAGTGTLGFNGASGLPINTLFHYPTSLFLDSQGQLYICDNFNQRIRVITNPPLLTPQLACLPASVNGLSPLHGVGEFRLNTLISYTKSAREDGTHYVDQSGYLSTTLTKGQTYLLYLTGTSNNVHRFRVFIDYNNDGDFDDPTETIVAINEDTISVNITIPFINVKVDTLLRIRVIADNPFNPGTTACSLVGDVSSGSGQAEDFNVLIKRRVIVSLDSGEWNSPTTWSCNCVPQYDDDVTIRNLHVITISQPVQCGKLTIGPGATLSTANNINIIKY